MSKKVIVLLLFILVTILYGSAFAVPFRFYPGSCLPSGAYSARLNYSLSNNGIRIYVDPSVSRISIIGESGNIYTFDTRELLQSGINQWTNRISNSALLPRMSLVSQFSLANVYVRPLNCRLFCFFVNDNSPDIAMTRPLYTSQFNQLPLFEPIRTRFYGMVSILQNRAITANFQQALSSARQESLISDEISEQQFARLYTQFFAVNAISNLLGFAPLHGEYRPFQHTVSVGNHDLLSPLVSNTNFLTYLRLWKSKYHRPFSNSDAIEISSDEVKVYMDINNGFGANTNNIVASTFNENTFPICHPSRNISYNTNQEITTPHIFGQNAPTWINLYHSGKKDFCSLTGNAISCYENDNGDFNKRVLYDNSLYDTGWSTTQVFMKAGKWKDLFNNRFYPVIGFCRLVGIRTHLYCDFFVSDHTKKFIRSAAKGDYGYLDGGWDDVPAFAGENKTSETRWWIDLNGKGMSFCRLIGSTNMACRIFNGIQARPVFAKTDIISENINYTYGESHTRGWISNWHGNPAYCRIAGSPSYIYCLPFNRKTMTFGKDVQVKGFNDYYSNDTIKWVDNFTLDGDSALCFLKHNSSGYSMHCLTASSDFTQEFSFPSVSDSGYSNSLGILEFPGVVGTKGWCGLVENRTKIQCQLFDNIYKPQGLQNRFVTAKSDQAIKGGLSSVGSGAQEWMNYQGKNALFCRKVNEVFYSNDMRCTRIYYR